MKERPKPSAAAFKAARIPVPRGAAERLKTMIEEERLSPGEPLPAQRELADRLGISRASLREALSALETVGLVVVRPGRGVFVAEPPPEGPWRFADHASPRDVYEARYCLEGFAASLAATRLSQDALDAIGRSVAALRAAYERSDLGAMAAADSALHDIIIEACGNPILSAMYRSVREMMTESQKLPLRRHVRLEDTVREHEDLAARLRERDPAAAGDGMRRHIREAARRYGLGLELPAK